MSKYKFKLKGKDEHFETYEKGDKSYITLALIQCACEMSIKHNVSKKEFIDKCKCTYDLIKTFLYESDGEK